MFQGRIIQDTGLKVFNESRALNTKDDFEEESCSSVSPPLANQDTHSVSHTATGGSYQLVGPQSTNRTQYAVFLKWAFALRCIQT